MDIEFIEEQHRDNIFKIMQLCNVDMAQAYQLYQTNGCNVEAAVQAKFNAFNNNDAFSQNIQQQMQYQNVIPSYGNNLGINRNIPQRMVGQGDQYENYKIFKQSGMNFNSRYQVKREQGFLQGLMSKFVKGQENGFKKKLQDYTGKRSNLKLGIGSLSESLQSVWKSKFPLIVHVLDFTNMAIRDHIRSIYGDQQFVQMLNTQFQNYGINAKQYQLQPYLRQFIDLKNDINSIIVLRVNIIDQIVLVSKIAIQSLNLAQIKKKIKQVKSNCINLEMEQLHLEKRYTEELKGNYDYQKPMSIQEQRKLKQDRQIRRKQQEQFFAAMKSQKAQQQKPLQKKKQQAPKKDLTKEEQQQRRKIRERLKVYPEQGQNLLAIKLRLPSSQSIKLNVSPNEPAQYLYDYVFSREENLGFEEDETKRQFDIIEPYDKINLSQRKREPLGKIFEGETMLSLIVSEKTE